MNRLVLLFTICLFISCESLQPERGSLENFSDPPINSILTKSIGDQLLNQGTKITFDSIHIDQDIIDLKVQKGFFKKSGHQQGYEIFEPVPSSGARIYDSAFYKNKFLAMKSEELYLCAYGGYGNIFQINRIGTELYKRETYADIRSDAFQQTLIYTGKEKDIIKLSYREFSNDLARPAFTVDVSYDLQESRILKFRNAEIEIINIDSNQITYKLLRGFR